MRKRPLRSGELAAVGLALFFSRQSLALSTSEAQGRATTAIQGVESEIGKPPPPSKFREPPATPAVRIANADMLLHAKNNDAAIEILSKVLELNRQALMALRCPKDLAVVPGATHLFEERGALEQVAVLAADWFAQHLSLADHSPAAPVGTSSTSA